MLINTLTLRMRSRHHLLHITAVEDEERPGSTNPISKSASNLARKKPQR
jgi:hypothetical protein